MANQVEHVFVGAAKPVLQRHEVGAYILRSARNKAQHLRNAAQHFHLRCTAGRGFFFVAPQLFQQGHGATGGLVHVKLAKARQLDDFAGRHHANHGIAVFTAGPQVVQNWQEVVFQEEHACHHDVCLCNVGLATRNGGVVTSIF